VPHCVTENIQQNHANRIVFHQVEITAQECA